MSEQSNWLVYSREHNTWWRPNRAGYTNDIEHAGRYTKAEAEGCCGKRDGQPDGSCSEFTMMAPEATERADAAEALLESLLFLAAMPDEGPTETFERIADAFHADTGYLRFGKSVPPAIAAGDYEERRDAAWKDWIERRWQAARDHLAARAAPPVTACLECEGHGYVVVTTPECCGHMTSTGECCGEAIPGRAQEACPDCGGAGTVPEPPVTP